jgi:hypothetical protein
MDKCPCHDTTSFMFTCPTKRAEEEMLDDVNAMSARPMEREEGALRTIRETVCQIMVCPTTPVVTRHPVRIH